MVGFKEKWNGDKVIRKPGIVCDPRRSNMKDILNLKIKKRIFRPFAPSILNEEVSKWFEQDGDALYDASLSNNKRQKTKFQLLPM